jgi:hypothetical protein
VTLLLRTLATMFTLGLVWAALYLLRDAARRWLAHDNDRAADAPDITLDDQPDEIKPLTEQDWAEFETEAQIEYEIWKASH